jgi:hypothetical protein
MSDTKESELTAAPESSTGKEIPLNGVYIPIGRAVIKVGDKPHSGRRRPSLVIPRGGGNYAVGVGDIVRVRLTVGSKTGVTPSYQSTYSAAPTVPGTTVLTEANGNSIAATFYLAWAPTDVNDGTYTCYETGFSLVGVAAGTGVIVIDPNNSKETLTFNVS